MAWMYRRDGELHRMAATHGMSPEFEAIARQRVWRPSRETVTTRAALEGRIVQVLDPATDPEYAFRDNARRVNMRTTLGVPLLREGEPVGVIGLARSHVKPFTQSV